MKIITKLSEQYEKYCTFICEHCGTTFLVIDDIDNDIKRKIENHLIDNKMPSLIIDSTICPYCEENTNRYHKVNIYVEKSEGIHDRGTYTEDL